MFVYIRKRKIVKKRLYLEFNSMPEFVLINKSDKIFYKNNQEFIEAIPSLFKLCENNIIYLCLDPIKCKNISFDTVFDLSRTVGLNRLNDYGDIRFYKLIDEKPVFNDLIEEFISSKNFIINDNYNEEGNYLLINVKKELLGYKSEKDIIDYIAPFFLTDEKLKDVAITKYHYHNDLKSLIYTIYRHNNNINDIKQIVRGLLLEDSIFSNIDLIKNNYKKINDYLNKYSILELSFNKIKGIINQEFDYQMIAYYNLMEDYNYRIDKFDFREKKIYFKNVY